MLELHAKTTKKALYYKVNHTYYTKIMPISESNCGILLQLDPQKQTAAVLTSGDFTYVLDVYNQQTRHNKKAPCVLVDLNRAGFSFEEALMLFNYAHAKTADSALYTLATQYQQAAYATMHQWVTESLLTPLVDYGDA